LGWYKQYKSWHFKKYQETVEEFCQVTGMDSWLLGCYFDHVHEVDFNEEKNIDAVAKTVDAIIAKTKKRFNGGEHQIYSMWSCHPREDGDLILRLRFPPSRE
jgi:hypothetical protein